MNTAETPVRRRNRKAAPLADRFWPKVDRRGPDECWEWQAGKGEHGYGLIGLGRRGSGQAGAHRVSWALANGPIDASIHVCHRCDNPPCVNPAHLFLGTRSDNMQDMVAKGRYVGRSILTRAQADEIRAIHNAGGVTGADIARRFGVSPAAVYAIVKGKRWAA